MRMRTKVRRAIQLARHGAEEADFQRALQANHRDPAPRGVYADWIHEHGDEYEPEAELHRHIAQLYASGSSPIREALRLGGEPTEERWGGHPEIPHVRTPAVAQLIREGGYPTIAAIYEQREPEVLGAPAVYPDHAYTGMWSHYRFQPGRAERTYVNGTSGPLDMIVHRLSVGPLRDFSLAPLGGELPLVGELETQLHATHGPHTGWNQTVRHLLDIPTALRVAEEHHAHLVANPEDANNRDHIDSAAQMIETLQAIRDGRPTQPLQLARQSVRLAQTPALVQELLARPSNYHPDWHAPQEQADDVRQGGAHFPYRVRLEALRYHHNPDERYYVAHIAPHDPQTAPQTHVLHQDEAQQLWREVLPLTQPDPQHEAFHSRAGAGARRAKLVALLGTAGSGFAPEAVDYGEPRTPGEGSATGLGSQVRVRERTPLEIFREWARQRRGGEVPELHPDEVPTNRDPGAAPERLAANEAAPADPNDPQPTHYEVHYDRDLWDHPYRKPISVHPNAGSALVALPNAAYRVYAAFGDGSKSPISVFFRTAQHTIVPLPMADAAYNHDDYGRGWHNHVYGDELDTQAIRAWKQAKRADITDPDVPLSPHTPHSYLQDAVPWLELARTTGTISNRDDNIKALRTQGLEQQDYAPFLALADYIDEQYGDNEYYTRIAQGIRNHAQRHGAMQFARPNKLRQAIRLAQDMQAPADVGDPEFAKPEGCTCDYPRTVLRNGSGHGRGSDGKPCPHHKEWLQKNVWGKKKGETADRRAIDRLAGEWSNQFARLDEAVDPFELGRLRGAALRNPSDPDAHQAYAEYLHKTGHPMAPVVRQHATNLLYGTPTPDASQLDTSRATTVSHTSLAGDQPVFGTTTYTPHRDGQHVSVQWNPTGYDDSPLVYHAVLPLHHASLLAHAAGHPTAYGSGAKQWGNTAHPNPEWHRAQPQPRPAPPGPGSMQPPTQQFGRGTPVRNVRGGDEEASFHRAIQAAPNDAAPRLIYADWLQDHGDPQSDADAERHRHLGQLLGQGIDPQELMARASGHNNLPGFHDLVVPYLESLGHGDLAAILKRHEDQIAARWPFPPEGHVAGMSGTLWGHTGPRPGNISYRVLFNHFEPHTSAFLGLSAYRSGRGHDGEAFYPLAAEEAQHLLTKMAAGHHARADLADNDLATHLSDIHDGDYYRDLADRAEELARILRSPEGEPEQLQRTGPPVRLSQTDHNAMTAAIYHAPEDLAPKQVYADMLEEEGSPQIATSLRNGQQRYAWWTDPAFHHYHELEPFTHRTRGYSRVNPNLYVSILPLQRADRLGEPAAYSISTLTAGHFYGTPEEYHSWQNLDNRVTHNPHDVLGLLDELGPVEEGDVEAPALLRAMAQEHAQRLGGPTQLQRQPARLMRHTPEFGAAMIANPQDMAHRLVYADHVEESGFPHYAEFLRRAAQPKLGDFSDVNAPNAEFRFGSPADEENGVTSQGLFRERGHCLAHCDGRLGGRELPDNFRPHVNVEVGYHSYGDGTPHYLITSYIPGASQQEFAHVPLLTKDHQLALGLLGEMETDVPRLARDDGPLRRRQVRASIMLTSRRARQNAQRPPERLSMRERLRRVIRCAEEVIPHGPMADDPWPQVADYIEAHGLPSVAAVVRQGQRISHADYDAARRRHWLSGPDYIATPFGKQGEDQGGWHNIRSLNAEMLHFPQQQRALLHFTVGLQQLGLANPYEGAVADAPMPLAFHVDDPHLATAAAQEMKAARDAHWRHLEQLGHNEPEALPWEQPKKALGLSMRDKLRSVIRLAQEDNRDLLRGVMAHPHDAAQHLAFADSLEESTEVGHPIPRIIREYANKERRQSAYQWVDNRISAPRIEQLNREEDDPNGSNGRQIGHWGGLVWHAQPTFPVYESAPLALFGTPAPVYGRYQPFQYALELEPHEVAELARHWGGWEADRLIHEARNQWPGDHPDRVAEGERRERDYDEMIGGRRPSTPAEVMLDLQKRHPELVGVNAHHTARGADDPRPLFHAIDLGPEFDQRRHMPHLQQALWYLQALAHDQRVPIRFDYTPQRGATGALQALLRGAGFRPNQGRYTDHLLTRMGGPTWYWYPASRLNLQRDGQPVRLAEGAPESSLQALVNSLLAARQERHYTTGHQPLKGTDAFSHLVLADHLSDQGDERAAIVRGHVAQRIAARLGGKKATERGWRHRQSERGRLIPVLLRSALTDGTQFAIALAHRHTDQGLEIAPLTWWGLKGDSGRLAYQAVLNPAQARRILDTHAQPQEKAEALAAFDRYFGGDLGAATTYLRVETDSSWNINSAHGDRNRVEEPEGWLNQPLRVNQSLPERMQRSGQAIKLAAQRDRPVSTAGAGTRAQSGNHYALIRTLREILDRSGLAPNKVLPAIHDVGGAARAAALAEVYGEERAGAGEYGAAWQGLIAHLPSLVVFRSHPQGPDSVYRLAFKGPQQAMSKLLDSVGVTSRVFVPHQEGSHVYIYDQGRGLRTQIGGLATRLKLTAYEHLGQGNPVGGDPEDLGRSQFRDTINAAEQGGGAPEGVQRQPVQQSRERFMRDTIAFANSIVSNHKDVAPKMVYADYVEEQGYPHFADFMRRASGSPRDDDQNTHNTPDLSRVIFSPFTSQIGLAQGNVGAHTNDEWRPYVTIVARRHHSDSSLSDRTAANEYNTDYHITAHAPNTVDGHSMIGSLVTRDPHLAHGLARELAVQGGRKGGDSRDRSRLLPLLRRLMKRTPKQMARTGQPVRLMKDTTAFAEAMLAAPEDDGHKLIYADYAEEQGYPFYADYIRRAHGLPNPQYDVPELPGVAEAINSSGEAPVGKPLVAGAPKAAVVAYRQASGQTHYAIYSRLPAQPSSVVKGYYKEQHSLKPLYTTDHALATGLLGEMNYRGGTVPARWRNQLISLIRRAKRRPPRLARGGTAVKLSNAFDAEGLLGAIRANPDDAAPRHALSDYLEENGTPELAKLAHGHLTPGVTRWYEHPGYADYSMTYSPWGVVGRSSSAPAVHAFITPYVRVPSFASDEDRREADPASYHIQLAEAAPDPQLAGSVSWHTIGSQVTSEHQHILKLLDELEPLNHSRYGQGGWENDYNNLRYVIARAQGNARRAAQPEQLQRQPVRNAAPHVVLALARQMEEQPLDRTHPGVIADALEEEGYTHWPQLLRQIAQAPVFEPNQDCFIYDPDDVYRTRGSRWHGWLNGQVGGLPVSYLPVRNAERTEWHNMLHTHAFIFAGPHVAMVPIGQTGGLIHEMNPDAAVTDNEAHDHFHTLYQRYLGVVGGAGHPPEELPERLQRRPARLMHETPAFAAKIAENPDDVAPKLAYADYVEEHGFPSIAAVIRRSNGVPTEHDWPAHPGSFPVAYRMAHWAASEARGAVGSARNRMPLVYLAHFQPSEYATPEAAPHRYRVEVLLPNMESGGGADHWPRIAGIYTTDHQLIQELLKEIRVPRGQGAERKSLKQAIAAAISRRKKGQLSRGVPVRLMRHDEMLPFVHHIEENPADLARHGAFADALEESGNPLHQVVRGHMHRLATGQGPLERPEGVDYHNTTYLGSLGQILDHHLSFSPHTTEPYVLVRWIPNNHNFQAMDYRTWMPTEDATELARHVGAPTQGADHDWSTGPWPYYAQHPAEAHPARLARDGDALLTVINNTPGLTLDDLWQRGVTAAESAPQLHQHLQELLRSGQIKEFRQYTGKGKFATRFYPKGTPLPHHQKSKMDVIIEKVKSGQKQSDVARELGVSRQRVNQAVDAAAKRHLI